MKYLLQVSLLLVLTTRVFTQSAFPPLWRRDGSTLLINPSGQPPLPTLKEASAAAEAAGMDLGNIQGDILVGMKKKNELFFFFSIHNATKFKTHLRTSIAPLITTTKQILDVHAQPLTMVNIAFSKTGLDTLGVKDSLNDDIFNAGQAADATILGDPGTKNWIPQFVGTKIHGVVLLASDTAANVNNTIVNITRIFGDSISEKYRLFGAARPGNQEGHEHFGFKDGISQPAINGFSGTQKFPGQATLDPGHILLSEKGDFTSRPAWAKDGSFLAFCQLKQLVPEFNTFLKGTGKSLNMSADLVGARMVGRWKSGAPVDLRPNVDDPALGADPQRNNNFNYTHPGKDISTNQEECPFSAHIRKTNPRADLGTFNNHIMRAGIPYGPEVTAAETKSGVSDLKLERGLAFVAYQSDLSVGFHFMQTSWANNPDFVQSNTGFDPIIGANNGRARNVTGLNKKKPSQTTVLMTDFVVSRGGEYFFSPSLNALRTTLSK